MREKYLKNKNRESKTNYNSQRIVDIKNFGRKLISFFLASPLDIAKLPYLRKTEKQNRYILNKYIATKSFNNYFVYVAGPGKIKKEKESRYTLNHFKDPASFAINRKFKKTQSI